LYLGPTLLLISLCGVTAQAQVPLIFTVAGNGTQGFSGDGSAAISAELHTPYGVALDVAGNIYIADADNNVVRKVTVASGIISTVAGNGTQGFSGDGSAAISAELHTPYGVALDTAGNIYIADTNNNVVRKVTVASGIISTVAGNGTRGFSGDGSAAISAELHSPNGMTLDAAGNIYIADEGNYCVRKVTASTGVISTVAGTCSIGYSGLGGADGTSVNSSDGGAATSAEMGSVSAVALDATGNIYIADTQRFHTSIRKVTVASGIISTVAGGGTQGYSGDGGAATSARLYNPYGVALDAAGNIYIADLGNCRIRKVTASTGIISTVVGNGTCDDSGDGGAATSAEIESVSAVALDAAGNIYLTDFFKSLVRKVALPISTTTILTTSNSSLYYSAPVTFAATVAASTGTATPTGTVTFYSDELPIGTGALNGSGVATLLNSSLGVGTHSIVANYPGNGAFSISADSISQTITQIPTGISFSISPSPSTFGSTVTMPISVTASNGATMSGSVSVVADGSNTLGSPTLNGSGNTSISVSTLALGSHSIVATYPGNTTYANSSETLPLTVTKATPTVTTWPTASSIIYSQTLASSTLTGGTASAAGTFTWTTPSTAPAVGTAAQSVTFSPTDSIDYSTVVSSIPVVVGKAPAALSIAASANPSTFGSSVTFTFTTTGVQAMPTGTLTITDNNNALTSVSINGAGIATYTTTSLAAGSNSITAVYNGDSNYF
jgi:sugar lactone lactonase YvrE